MLAEALPIPGTTYTEHAEGVVESTVAVHDMPLNLIALEIPLDEGAIALMFQEAMHLAKRTRQGEVDQ